MGLVIKYPTLITESTKNGFDNQVAMIDNVTAIFERYNNREESERLVVSTRGKTKEKVIKSVETSRIDMGDDHCLLLKIEEYKQGYGDLYLDSTQNVPRDITSSDKLGSKYNFALMYPFINHDDNDNNINRWVVFIYDTPDKDDRDLINTVKCVVSKILGKKFLNVINRNMANLTRYPWVSVRLTSVENVNNQSLDLNQYVYSAKETKAKEVWYQDVPIDKAEQLRDERPDRVECGLKRVVKFFTSSDKKNYLKYEFEYDGQGSLASTLMEKYSYSKEVDNIDDVYKEQFMYECFLEVLSQFLANE